MFSSGYLSSQSELAAECLRGQFFLNPLLFKAYQWNSDFNHDPNWTVVPIYLNYSWCRDEMHTFEHPLAGMGKGLFVEHLNSSALETFPVAISYLQEFIESDCVNYVGVSVLPPRTTLSPHVHNNPGNLKLHACVFSPSSCGLTFSNIDRSFTHQWGSQRSSVFFDDNFLHSAWNYSSVNRYVLIIDFKRDMLFSYPSHIA